ncbi:MAG TPA: flagellar assembly protein FliW [Acidimicrobiia bacterium]
MTVETPPEISALHFPDGIPGFPHLTEFTLVEVVEDGAFQLLQSLEDEDVAMVVCVPWLFFPDYAPEISEEDQEALGLERPEDAIVFCPVTLEPESRAVHLNLLGPFVVHRESLVGRQVVLADSDYPVRATVDLGAA